MDKKKDNSNLIIIIAVLCVILASVASVMFDKVTGSQVTDPTVLAVTDPLEFTAVAKSEYDGNGTVTLELQTNAPDGSVFTYFASHPSMETLTDGELVVKKGVASTSFELATDLPTEIVKIMVFFDVSAQGENSLAVERYGVNGEKMTGPNIGSVDGVTMIGFTSASFFYPSKDAVKELYNGYFEEETIPIILYVYEGMITDVRCVDGDWANVEVVFLNEFVDELWDAFLQTDVYNAMAMFEELPSQYLMVEDGEKVNVTFFDEDGNELYKNY